MFSLFGIEFNKTDIFIIPVFLAFVGFFINHRLTRSRSIESERIKASIKFREKILEIFKGLYLNPVDWPENSALIVNILTDIFPELDSAVAEFRPFIPFYKRWLFDKAWFRYRCSTGRKIDTQCYHHYINFDSNPEYKDIFHKNVSKLLSFAKVN